MNQKEMTNILYNTIDVANSIEIENIEKMNNINKEKKLYNISDFIGCMSPANVSYLLNNNRELSSDKVEINPNSIEVDTLSEKSNQNLGLFTKYNIPNDKTIFLVGGNLGIPQGIEFLKKKLLK